MKLPFKIKILLPAGVILFLGLNIGCKDQPGKGNKDGISGKTATIINEWPQPDSFTGEIPVFDNFSGLEPLFRFENDTTYVINFWATWCKPCLEELPYFEAFNNEMQEEKVKVVLVSLDFPKQLESKLVPFVQKQQLKSKVVVLLDGKYNEWIDKVSVDWSGAIPATYIYRGGQHLLVATPFENLEELKENVIPFL